MHVRTFPGTLSPAVAFASNDNALPSSGEAKNTLTAFDGVLTFIKRMLSGASCAVASLTYVPSRFCANVTHAWPVPQRFARSTSKLLLLKLYLLVFNIS